MTSSFDTRTSYQGSIRLLIWNLPQSNIGSNVSVEGFEDTLYLSEIKCSSVSRTLRYIHVDNLINREDG
jgi:hypothetical protein